MSNAHSRRVTIKPSDPPRVPWSDSRRFTRVLKPKTRVSLSAAEGRTPPAYPYTKGQQLTNDGIGFGEHITECRVPDVDPKAKQPKLEVLDFRRTRTGKALLNPNEEKAFRHFLQGRTK